MVSAKGRYEPVVRSLPEVSSKTPSRESAVLTYQCWELAVLAYLQKEKT
jgi:hypothetical protein